MATQKIKVAGISDEAVRAKTGRGWKEWFALMDKIGARKMAHKDIAEHLYNNHKISGWWSQMVTVGYEQARGMREKHQKPEGYEISVSRTLEVPISKVYKAWQNDETRNKWLGEDGLGIRKANANKSMRITWVDQKTSLEVNFYSKGPAKSQVVVQHSKLPNSKAAAAMKNYWSKNLDRLKEFLKA